ncbi:serine/threonine-protein kinase [Ramlibacter sp. AN1015]|uniref:CHASE2 domain-containing serine/threonine-protein kinase n=1 Tax=Ramlibacter sp. AN1015 TaxID=3133428 RepID=UPI0030C3EAD3
MAVLALHLATDIIGTLERRFYDWGSTQGAREPSDRVAVIAIDDASIAAIGRWPWPRDVHAALIDRLAAAGAKTIVHTTLFVEPQTERGLEYIRRLRDALPPDADTGLAQLVREAEEALDSDAKLARSLRSAGNVLLPALLTLGEPMGRPERALPDWLARTTVAAAPGFAVEALAVQAPIESLGAVSAGVGHLNLMVDVDGAVREVPLLIDLHGQAIPSLALLAVARDLNLQPGDLQWSPGEELRLGRLRLPTDSQSRMLPRFPAGERAGRRSDPFHEVLAGTIPAERYRGKTVLIGATAAGVGSSFAVPGHPALAPVEVLAQVTSSILSGHAVGQPAWAALAAAAAVLLVAAYLLALLPRLSAGWGAAVTAVLFAGLLGSEFFALARASVWVPCILAATLLLAGHLALTTRRFLVTESGKRRSDDESAETNRMMGLALQGQGQLDMAFDRFRRVPLGDALMDNLYNLGLDFERRRQFNKAEAIYRHMASWNADYKDLRARLGRARNLSETVILGGASGTAGGTLVLDDGAVEKPMLGRYQLEKELGKGAMGVVYLGRDPRIGRAVAIKTLALGQEFAGDDLEEARRRFFREAETAGRLAHPNIVTIFDAGEEHDLAYIAMEFLHGRDLSEHAQAAHLLPPATVVSIGARVAEALAYAHEQGVIHRDIKPANIMYEPAADLVKVTDFGIARVTDASRTRTGTILGTPSYMSPEQLAGRRVDGRTDLYSLAVMLFQLLTGTLPFRGDSLAEMMFKIANEPAADLRSVAPQLPPALAEAIARALAKEPDARVPDGLAFAAELRACEPSLRGVPALHAPAPQGVGTGATRGYDATRRVQQVPTRDTEPPSPGAATAPDIRRLDA